jgi:hypothetical protein
VGESISLALIGDAIGPLALLLVMQASSMPLVMTDKGVVLNEADGGGVTDVEGLKNRVLFGYGVPVSLV